MLVAEDPEAMGRAGRWEKAQGTPGVQCRAAEMRDGWQVCDLKKRSRSGWQGSGLLCCLTCTVGWRRGGKTVGSLARSDGWTGLEQI